MHEISPDQPHDLPPASTLAQLLLELNPEIPERILWRHVPDSHGSCTVCSLPQGGPQAWPCTLHAIATEAEQLLRSRALPWVDGRRRPRRKRTRRAV